MSDNEKLLLLQLILEDIRGNWGWGLEDRVDEALDIAEELELEVFIKSINEYKENCADGDSDGRHFRTGHEDGGYMDMETLHGLSKTIIDKSDEFKICMRILTYPEYGFTDWKEYKENKHK